MCVSYIVKFYSCTGNQNTMVSYNKATITVLCSLVILFMCNLLQIERLYVYLYETFKLKSGIHSRIDHSVEHDQMILCKNLLLKSHQLIVRLHNRLHAF